MFSRSIACTLRYARISNIRKTFQLNNLSANKTYRLPVSKVCIVNRMYSEQVSSTQQMIANFEEVKRATENNTVLIVDVREPHEIQEHGKIPNSLNIPLGNISAALQMPEKRFQQVYQRKKPSENTEIIFYCMIGKRSGMAQQNAINLGYNNTKNYLGSWTEWAQKSTYVNTLDIKVPI